MNIYRKYYYDVDAYTRTARGQVFIRRFLKRLEYFRFFKRTIRR